MASFLILLSDNSLQAHKPKFDDELEDLVDEIDAKGSVKCIPMPSVSITALQISISFSTAQKKWSGLPTL